MKHLSSLLEAAREELGRRARVQNGAGSSSDVEQLKAALEAKTQAYEKERQRRKASRKKLKECRSALEEVAKSQASV